MRKCLALITFLFLAAGVKAQESNYGNIELYMKLYKEGKISGDAYMAMLYTSASLFAAEMEGKLHAKPPAAPASSGIANNNATPQIDDERVASALKLVLSGGVNNMSIADATQTILTTAGLTGQPGSQAADVLNMGKAIAANKDIFSNPAMLGDGLSFLALRSGAVSETDALSYASGTVYLNEMVGGSFVSPGLLTAGVKVLFEALEKAAEQKAINNAKTTFFNTHMQHLSGYISSRDKSAFPDIAITPSNYKEYFQPFSYNKALAKGLSSNALCYKAAVVNDGILVSYNEAEITKVEARRLVASDYETFYMAYPFFKPEMKFDFSRDFEFRMKVSASEKTRVTLRFNIGDYYNLYCTPYINTPIAHIAKANESSYNPGANKIQTPAHRPMPVMFKGTPHNDKELVIKKQGYKLIAYWVNDNDKQTELDLDIFPNNGGFKWYISTDYQEKSDNITIKDVSLRYL